MTAGGISSPVAPFDNGHIDDRRVLFCCRATPDYYRRPLFSHREVFCGPDCADLTAPDGRIVSLHTPAGEYDINAVVARLPAEQRPDLVVVKADATRGNFPRGFDRLHCPKVLVVGDTHHFPAPLRHMLRYAGMETFELIVTDHTRQHAHFFHDLGFERVYWIPAVDYALRYRDIPASPTLPLTFIGQTGAFHPYRRHALETVQRAGLPLGVYRVTPEETADIQAASAITLNCSLNGDLNLRVFEGLGAGAFLLTDRLAPQAGLDRLFEAGRHLDTYASPGELVEKIRYYLAHPGAAMDIRTRGQAHLLAVHAPGAMRRRFFDLLDHDRVEPALDLGGERRGPMVAGRDSVIRRVTAYEPVQQLHLRAGRLTLVVDEADALGVAATAADLPRVRVIPHGLLLNGGGASPLRLGSLTDEEVLVLPWPETAEGAGTLMARFQGRHVLAVGKSWSHQRTAAAFLAGWGFAETDDAGLYRLTDPFAAAERVLESDPAGAAAWMRVADLADMAHNAGQAWRAFGLARRLGDPVLEERLLLRCVSLDRGHVPALQALAGRALAAGRSGDAAVFAGALIRHGAVAPEFNEAAVAPEFNEAVAAAAGDPRVAALNAVAGLPAVQGGIGTRKADGQAGGFRVLVVTNLFPPQEFGGYGRKLWEFTAELRRRGHRVKVLTVDAPDFARPGMVGTDDLEPMVERSLGLYGIWQDGTAYMHEDPAKRAAVTAFNDRRILQAAADFGADVCLAGNIDLLSDSFLAALCAQGVPVVHCVGNQNPGYPPERAPRSPLFRLGPASGWVAGKLDREGYADIPKTILYPGGRVDSFYQPVAPAYDRLRIAFAGLITAYKGPQVLINALAILHHHGMDFECDIAGDAPDSKFMTSLREFCAPRFGNRVRFPGFLDRRGLAALFSRCNVLAFPSVFEEPFGITQVEAMASGLLVISSGSGGSGEIVRHEVDGLIAPPSDAEALANALAGLSTDPARWERLARQGQARALSFTVSRTVDHLEAAFAELLTARI